jgi:hypothetical protein
VVDGACSPSMPCTTERTDKDGNASSDRNAAQAIGAATIKWPSSLEQREAGLGLGS